MIFQGKFLTKHGGLRTDSLSLLKRSTTKRNVASDRQLVSEEKQENIKDLANSGDSVVTHLIFVFKKKQIISS